MIAWADSEVLPAHPGIWIKQLCLITHMSCCICLRVRAHAPTHKLVRSLHAHSCTHVQMRLASGNGHAEAACGWKTSHALTRAHRHKSGWHHTTDALKQHVDGDFKNANICTCSIACAQVQIRLVPRDACAKAARGWRVQTCKCLHMLQRLCTGTNQAGTTRWTR